MATDLELYEGDMKMVLVRGSVFMCHYVKPPGASGGECGWCIPMVGGGHKWLCAMKTT